MNYVEDIIKGEIEALLVERGIVIPLSLVMPDFSCQCEPDDADRLYVMYYNLPNPVRGIKGVVAFINGVDDSFRIETSPLKLVNGGLGARQHAVYNNLKRKVADYYRSGLIEAGWTENCDDSLSPFFTPPWDP